MLYQSSTHFGVVDLDHSYPPVPQASLGVIGYADFQFTFSHFMAINSFSADPK